MMAVRDLMAGAGVVTLVVVLKEMKNGLEISRRRRIPVLPKLSDDYQMAPKEYRTSF